MKKKTKQLEDCIRYGFEHNLKAFRDYYKDTNQKKNYIMYVNKHKEIQNSIKELIEAGHNPARLRNLVDEFSKWTRNRNRGDYPNLYFYEIEKMYQVLDMYIEEAMKHIPVYYVRVFDSDFSSNNGIRRFRTRGSVYMMFNGYDDVDFKAKTIINGKEYLLHKLEDIDEMFNYFETFENSLLNGTKIE